MPGTVSAGDTAVSKPGKIHCSQEFLTSEISQITNQPSNQPVNHDRVETETDAMHWIKQLRGESGGVLFYLILMTTPFYMWRSSQRKLLLMERWVLSEHTLSFRVIPWERERVGTPAQEAPWAKLTHLVTRWPMLQPEPLLSSLEAGLRYFLFHCTHVGSEFALW